MEKYSVRILIILALVYFVQAALAERAEMNSEAQPSQAQPLSN